MRKGEQFAGLTVAMVTPFHEDGSIDFVGIDKLVDWHIEQGTDCLAPVGTTGESPTLDHDEHHQIVERVVKRANGRIKIMAGTGSNSTREAISLTKHAKEIGVDGALMVGPYYNKPTQEGYRQHFLKIADTVQLPIVLYNIPGRTASNIAPETIIKLAEHPNIVAIKEATGLMDQASQILANCDLTLLSGDDSLTLPLMSLGASGVVSVVGNIVPKDIRAVVTQYRDGKLAEAQKTHYKLFNMCRELLSLATNPIPIKTAMKFLGRSNGVLRLPMCATDAAGEKRIREVLTQYGLL